ncbi:uncharacterized protein LOC127754712 [Oryza glaberrima]|uniref:uncharacterized protein LOC127754712 n=1 Tax=Oryza glaberrima TaxID=4538 RepID=UPI00224C4763|nr:uncharacterized protein LOC127754712 [Oryza glaberrima]
MAGRYYTPPTPRPPPENMLDVFMDGDAVAIRATITSSHYLTAQFVNKIAHEHHEGGGVLIVGIDTEWREDHEPDDKKCYKVAVLQLFLNHRCLVFQLYQASNEVPRELAEFLADAGVRFVGVGVDGGVR